MSERNKRSSMSISVGSLLWIALIVWLVVPNPRPTERRVNELRTELKELRREVSQLRATLAKPADAPPTTRDRQIQRAPTRATENREREVAAASTRERPNHAADDVIGTSDSSTEASAPPVPSPPPVPEDLDVERE